MLLIVTDSQLRRCQWRPSRAGRLDRDSTAAALSRIYRCLFTALLVVVLLAVVISRCWRLPLSLFLLLCFDHGFFHSPLLSHATELRSLFLLLHIQHVRLLSY